MTRDEVAVAVELLDPLALRIDLIADTGNGGRLIRADWLSGGSRLHSSLVDVAESTSCMIALEKAQSVARRQAAIDVTAYRQELASFRQWAIDSYLPPMSKPPRDDE
ncbi:MAG: hypothetical protein AAF805_00240 [Planctomycetota bacterium]